MIDKKVLQDMGFRLAEGWDHEVWFHDSDFLVHLGKEFEQSRYEVSGDLCMKEFFDKFLDNVRQNESDKYERTY